METNRWNQKPLVNAIIDIIIENRGEVLDKRIEELLKKDFPYINSLLLEEIFMKLETQEIINVFKVSKTKNMIVINKRTQKIKDTLMKEFH